MTIPKFRAWHKHLKKMMPVLCIDLDPEFGGVYVWGKSYVDYFTGEHEADRDFWPWSDIELMQYVGHDDAEGHEIYEGDILQIEDATAKVVFWESPPEFGLDYYHNEEKWCEDWNLTDDSERMKIIGNIWQHPELLKQQGLHS